MRWPVPHTAPREGSGAGRTGTIYPIHFPLGVRPEPCGGIRGDSPTSTCPLPSTAFGRPDPPPSCPTVATLVLGPWGLAGAQPTQTPRGLPLRQRESRVLRTSQRGNSWDSKKKQRAGVWSCLEPWVSRGWGSKPHLQELPPTHESCERQPRAQGNLTLLKEKHLQILGTPSIQTPPPRWSLSPPLSVDCFLG